ncbi:hypothetical protein YC2023_046164 [Brassica napus]
MRNWLMRKKKRPRILCLSESGGEDDADMHKHHGLFVPNVEYLKDPEGFSLTSVLRFGLRAVPCIQQLRSCKKESSRIALW